MELRNDTNSYILAAEFLEMQPESGKSSICNFPTGASANRSVLLRIHKEKRGEEGQRGGVGIVIFRTEIKHIRHCNGTHAAAHPSHRDFIHRPQRVAAAAGSARVCCTSAARTRLCRVALAMHRQFFTMETTPCGM